MYLAVSSLFPFEARRLPFPLSQVYRHVNELAAKELAASLVLFLTGSKDKANEIFTTLEFDV